MDLLAVDIGNTSTCFARFAGGKFKNIFRLSTKDLVKPSGTLLKKKLWKKNIQAAVIASVVPSAGESLKSTLSGSFGIKTYLIGKDFQAPVTNLYKDPEQVGADRLMNAIAAFDRTRKEAIVIDFGTAITFDIISKKGEYLGGVIAPGIEISLEALYQRTALLPKIRLAHPKNLIGKDTIESIRVGCSVGIGGLCDRVVSEIVKKYHLKPVVIGTGGYALFMRKYCSCIESMDAMLTMKGIVLSYKKFLTKNLKPL